MMNLVYGELINAYKTMDGKKFKEIVDKYNLGLTSLDQVGVLEKREVLELSMLFDGSDVKYIRNYITSRKIIDTKPIYKHMLDIKGVSEKSYALVVYKVLNAIKKDPFIDLVLDMVDINMDKDMAKNYLLERKLIQYEYKDFDELKQYYSNYTVDELKSELEFHSLDLSGKKMDLVNRLVDHLYYVENEFDKVSITSKGIFELNVVDWVKIYESGLDYFDFDEYVKYLSEHSFENIIYNSIKFLNEHLKIAYEREDFQRLHDVFSAKAFLYISQKEYYQSLIEELKIFILKLNPVFIIYDVDENYNVMEYPNINNISILMKLNDIILIDDLFNQAWDEINFDEYLISRKVSLSYLKKALRGKIIPELDYEIKKDYFQFGVIL